MRKCKTCEIEKEMILFRDNRKQCKSCCYLENKKWRQEVKYDKDYYIKNKEIIDEKQREYHINNRYERLAYGKKYREENKDKIRKINRRYENSEKGKIKRRLIWQKRRAQMINQSDGTLDGNDEFITNMLEEQNCECVICECNISKGYELDHIIPLSKGGIHGTCNVQLLCMLCNRKKGNIVESFKA